MRKTGWFVVVVGVVVACAVVAVGGGAVWKSQAQEQPAASSWCRAGEPALASVAAVPMNNDQALVKELIKLLDETKSLDTFAVTASALCKMGPKARMAFPAIIRSAERLKLLDKHLGSQKETRKKKMLEEFGEGLALLLPELKNDPPPAPPATCAPGAASGAIIGHPASFGNAFGAAEQCTATYPTSDRPALVPLPEQAKNELAPPTTNGEIAATALARAYQINEAFADEEYTHKVLEVTGAVGRVFASAISDGEGGHYWVLVLETFDSPPIHCYFPPSAQKQLAQLRCGREITFKGKCGRLGSLYEGKTGGEVQRGIVFHQCVFPPGPDEAQETPARMPKIDE
jgi:hypothetical protein